MSRYVPTATECEAIETLTLAGHAVVRQRTYDDLLDRVRIAKCVAGMEIERRESAERWAHRCLDEERRLSRRLDEVCTAAASLGVPIQAINNALDEATR